MKSMTKEFISLIFIFLVFLIALLCIIYFPFDIKSILISTLLLVIITLYRKGVINKSVFYGIMLVLLLFGIGVRFYFINGLSFNLASDFKLAFNTGKDITNGLIPSESYYLSYNGYFYIFSYLVSLVFKVFGVSLKAVLYTNLVLQLLSLYFLYKIISSKASKETSVLLTVLYFLMPSIIAINFLVTTENPFLLMMFICIYMALNLLNKKEFKLSNFIWFVILGILLSFTNYIRPAIAVFLIAFVIYYVINMKKFKEIVFIVILVLSYFVSNVGFNYFIESGLNENLRSGAMGWGVYFGTNYDSGGLWTEEDSNFVFDVLKDESKGNKDLLILSWERLESYGALKTSMLFMKKYRNLWAFNNGPYDFVNSVVDYEKTSVDFAKYENVFASSMQLIIIVLCIASIYSVFKEVKEKGSDFFIFELFGILYILANMLACVNGRYSIPLYPVLIICSSIFVDKIINNKEAY